MSHRLFSRVRAVYIWLMAPILGFAVFLVLATPTAQAASSSTYLNFQARLLNNSGSGVPDGTYNIDFKLYNADSTTGSVGTCTGACLWEETRTGSDKVTVINGYFSVNLGSVTAFPSTINWDQQLWLTMNIGGTGGSPTWDGEMQNSGHSILLTALPYSFAAGQLAQTSGAHRGTLAFNTVATDPSIILPDASGTVCLQTSSSCGFESTSGTDFIRNQTTTQTANFNIQSSAAGSVAAVIQGAASQSVDLLDVKTSAPSTVLSIGATGSLSVTPASASDTITLGSISETGTITLGQSTASNTISIGAAAGNGNTQTINIGTSSTAGSTTNVTIGSSIAGTTTLQGGTGISLNGNTTLAASDFLKITGSGTRPGSPTEGMLYFDTSTHQLLQYNGNLAKWVSAPRSSTLIVAANNSSQADKDAADYVASGSADQTTINTALTALPAGGGSVYLMEGTYTLSAAISMPNNTTLSGAGASTIITIPNSQNGSYSMITNSDIATGTGITVQNLLVDGNSSHNGSGNMVGVKINGVGGSGKNGATVSDVTAQNLTSDGLQEINSTNVLFTANTVLKIATSGIDLSSGSNNAAVGNTVDSVTSFGGIEAAGSKQNITGNMITNAAWGVYFTGVSNGTISGNTIIGGTNSTRGIYLNSASNNVVSGNKVFDIAGASNNNGIYLDSTSSKNTISSNDITDSSCTSTCYAINLSASTVTSNYLNGNHFLGDGTHAATINDAGTTTIYANQPLSENGDANFRNATNSAAAYQLQNAAGSNALSIDTTSLNGFLTNSSFENGSVATWTYSGAAGGSVARDTTQAYLGTADLKVITGTTAAANDGVKSTLNSTLAASTTYTISWYDYISSGTFSDITARFSYDGTTGNASDCTSTFSVTAGAWSRHSCQFTTGSAGTAPTSSNAIYIVQHTNNGGTQRTFYIDAVQLEQASQANAYKETGINLQGTVTSNTIFSGLLTLQPSASLVAGQSEITQSFVNGDSTGGTVNGFSQTITVNNISSAGTTNGLNINLTDNTSFANNNDALNISLSGTNTSQNQVGVNASVNNGIAIQGYSTGYSSTGCGGFSNTGVGLCGVANGGTASSGIFGQFGGGNVSNDISSPLGSAIYARNITNGVSGFYAVGLRALARNSTSGAISIGVYGDADNSSGNGTVYGGYFQLRGNGNSGAALYASNSTNSVDVVQFQDNTTDVFVVGDNGMVTLNPAAALTGSSTQSHISQSLTNNQTGGTVNGLNQSITISNSSGTTTTNGLNINLTDSTSLGNTNAGLKVSLAGTNSSQQQYGVDSTANHGIAIRGISSGTGSSSTSCGSGTFAYSLGVCGYSSASSNAVGVFGTKDNNVSTSGHLDFLYGAGVIGYDNGSGTAGDFYIGTKGMAFQSANAAYTSIGVYGSGGANSSGSPTTYGGYFTLDPSSLATNGAALYATNSSIAANIVQFQDNASDVFVIGDGGSLSVTPSDATKTITVGSTSETGGLTFGQSTDTNTINIGNANTATGKTQTINIGAGSPAGTGKAVINIGNTSNASALNLNAGTGNITLTGNTTINNNSSSGLVVNDSASSKPVMTVDTTGDAVLLGQSSGMTGKLTFYNNGGSHTVSILGPNSDPASSFSLTLPSALPGSTQCLQSSNTGALSFTNCVSGTAVTTIGTYSSSNHYGDGASISGSTLTLGSADATHPGLIDTSNQSFSGSKTFSSGSTTAFQVQDGSNIDLFNVNTTDGYIINNGTPAIGNEIQNPSFESSGTTESTGWYTPSGTQVITNSAANAHSGNYELQVTGNSSTHAVTTKWFAVHPSDTIYAEAYVKNSAGANGDGGIYLEFADKDKGNSTFSNADTGLPGTSYVLKSIQTTVPASKYFVRLAASVKATSTTGTFYFDDFYLRLGNQQAPLLINNSSSTALEVNNISGTTIFGVDTSASKIFSTIADGGTAVGFTLNTPSYTTAGAKLLSLQNSAAEKFYVDKDGNVNMSGGITAGGDITTTGNVNIGSGKVYKVNGTQISSADLSNNSDLAKLSGTGPQNFTGNNKFSGTVLLQNSSSTEFQVQHAANAVFTVDTSGDKIILGAASNITGKIVFQGNGGAGTLTLAGPATPDVGNYTLSIPAITANANVCTDNSICSGYASSASLTSGLAGKLNKNAIDTSSASVTALQGNLYTFTNASANIASGVLKIDNGSNTGNALYVTGTEDYGSGNAYIVVNNTNGTPTGNLIDLQANGADEFTVDASGNTTVAGNLSIASGKQYQINGVQIASSNLSDGSNLAKLNGTQTFTGANTFSNAGNSFTGDGSNLTNLNATNISSGTLNDGRLTSNVALLNRSAQSFTGDNTFAPTANNVGTTIKQTSGTATSGSVLDVQTANGTSHFFQVTNAAANEGAVTLQSVGATRDLTIGSGSGTVFVAAATGTIQHNNASLTIDVDNGTDSTLTITNAQAAAVASLSVEGDISVGASRVYKVGATSGVGVTCAGNTFSQNQVTNGGIVTSNTCSNAVTTVGSPSGTNANGASISGNTLTLTYADASNPGIVSTSTQTFAGAKTVKVNDSSAFQVQNTSARSLFNVDTTGNVVTIGNSTDGAQITLGATGNANGTIRKTMVVNGSISGNDLVEIDTGNAGQVKQAAASSTKVFGIATSAVGSGGTQDIVIGGIYQVNANASGGTINIGDTLVSSSTAGQATKAGSTTSSGSVVGLALSTLSGGKVWVYMNLGLGGSDNLQTVYNKDTGGTTPDLKVSSSVGGLDVQDADTATNSSLLTVRNSNSSGLGAAIFDVQSANPITDITNNANNNLVTNGSFETGTTGWAKLGSTQSAPTQDTTKKYTGSASLKIVTNATDSSGTDGASYNLTTSTLVSNTQYTMIVYARADDGTSLSSTFQMGRAENGSTNTDCLASAQSVSASWTEFSCTFTTGTTSSTPYVYVRQTDQVARTFYIDGILLYRTSLLSNQFADQTFAAGDWQAKGGATVTRDTSQNEAGAGTASVKIATSTTASNNDGVKHNITLNDSTFYRLNFWALLDSGSSAFTTMEAGYSSDGSTDNTVCITGQSVTTTWTQYSCSFTTPSSHSGTPFFYVKELNTTGIKTFYIDALTLSIGNPLNAYGEGLISLNGIISSPISLQNQSNSTTAFQIQNTSGSNLFNVDTANTAITVTAGTINSTLALGDFPSGGSIGSAASTVDIYTSISVAQTHSGQTLTVPTPTASTTYGRMLYLSNVGSQSFILGGVRVPPGDTATLMWSNTNGGASWQFAGAGASSIENQNTADQTADFRISGTGRANTSFITPLLDSITGGLSIGTSTATSITIGNTANSTGTLLRSQDGSAAFQVQDVASAVVLGVGTSLDSANFIPNSSFESAISGWTVTAGASAQDTTAGNAYSGGATYKMNTAGTSNQSGVYYSNTALTNGQQYSISVEVKAASGSFTTFEMGWRTSGGTFNNCNSAAGTINTAMVPASGTSVGTSGWTRFTCVLTPNATGGNVYFRLSAASTQQWYIDSVFVEATTSGVFKGFEEGTTQLAGTVQTAVVFRPTNDSTTDFQVQSSNGTNVLTVDTLNGDVVIGSKSSDPTICTNGAILYRSDTNRFRACENGSWINIDSYVDVQAFSASGTWTKPSLATQVDVYLVGAGGGGGAGAARTPNTEKDGGGGGGGGALFVRTYLAGDLPSTVSVTIGTGGGGGAGANGANGGNGSAGGATCFSSSSSCGGTIYGEAFGGGGGAGGNSAQGGGGGGGGGVGAAGSNGANTSNAGAVGGGPGGGASNTSASGGAGAGGGNGGTTTGVAGSAGPGAEYGGAGGGGAGGGSTAPGAGGSSLHGAGGGGAGASTSGGNNSSTSGGAGGITGTNTAGGGGGGSTSTACNSSGTAGTNGTTNSPGSTGAFLNLGTGGGGAGANGQGGGQGNGCTGGNGGAPGGGAGGGGAGSGNSNAGGGGGTGGAGGAWVISH